MTGYFAIICAGIVWGTGGLAARFLQELGVHPMTMVLMRLMGAWMGHSTWLLLHKSTPFKITKRELLVFLALAALSPGGAQPLFILSITSTTLAVATILNYTSPLFVVILERMFLREHITAIKAAALILVLAGLVLITGVVDSRVDVSPFALITGAGSGLFLGAYVLILKRAVGGRDPITVLWWVNTLGFPMVAAYNALSGNAFPIDLPAAAYGIAFANAAGSGFTAHFLFTYGLTKVQAGRASIAATAEPVAATILGMIFLKEIITLSQSAGMILVIVGIVLVSADAVSWTRKRMPEVAQVESSPIVSTVSRRSQ